jgi:hypothetical protein
MNDFIALLSGGLGGSILGTVGGIFSKVWETKQRAKDQEHEYKMAQVNQAHEAQMSQLNAHARMEELEVGYQTKVAEGEYQGLIASIESDKATFSAAPTSKWMIAVDFIRGTMRSWLTSLLVIYMGLALLYLTQHYNVQLTNAQVYDLITSILTCLVTCTSASLLWWFGSRGATPKKGE